MTTNRRSGLTPAEKQVRAAALRDLLICSLIEHGPMDVFGLMQLANVTKGTVYEYMSKLVKAGRAHSTRIPVHGRPHVRMVIYSAEAGEQQPQPGDYINRTTITDYPLHHVRDELVAYLFGAPKQHGEMTK